MSRTRVDTDPREWESARIIPGDEHVTFAPALRGEKARPLEEGLRANVVGETERGDAGPLINF